MRRALALALLFACSEETRPQLSVEPGRLDLGRLSAGERRDLPLLLRSTGDAPLLIETIVASDPAFVVEALQGIELPPGGAMQAIVRYVATEVGAIDAHVTIVSAAGITEVPIQGNVEGTGDPDAGVPDAKPDTDAGDPDANETPDAEENPDAEPCVPVFDTPRPLAGTSTNAGYEENAAVATNGFGTWVAVFASDDELEAQIGGDLDLFFSRSIDDGQTWSYAEPLAFNLAQGDAMEMDQFAWIAYGGNDSWIVTWQADLNEMDDRGRVYTAISLDDGETFSAPVELVLEQDDAIPTVASDGLTWIVAWHAHELLSGTVGTDGDINYVRSTNAGLSWSPIGVINDQAPVDGAWDGDVRIEAMGADSFIAVWQTNHDGPGYGPDDDVLFSRSFDGGETWENALPVLGDPTEDNGEFEPVVAVDRAGRIVVAWAVNDEFETLMVANSTDGGDTWSWRAAATDAPSDSNLTVATDGAGTFLIAWHSHVDLGTNGTDGDIYGILSQDGGMTWGETYLLNANADIDTADDWDPHLASDGKRWQLIYQANAPRDLLFISGAYCE